MKNLLFQISPILLFEVTGFSMLPIYKPGDRVVVLKWLVFPALKDVVVLKDPRTGTLIVKRIVDIAESSRKTNNFFGRKEYYVRGDNADKSTDSRTFGWVQRKNIIGKIIFPKV